MLLGIASSFFIISPALAFTIILIGIISVSEKVFMLGGVMADPGSVQGI
jgi:hypothetical protein